MSGCEVEFNGFITAASNLFIEQSNAIEYADSVFPALTIEQKTYSCSNDVTIQYSYYEVGSPEPQPTQLCKDNFTAYLAANTDFLGQQFRTEAEAQQRATEILEQFPFGSALVRRSYFVCENGALIERWFVQSQI